MAIKTVMMAQTSPTQCESSAEREIEREGERDLVFWQALKAERKTKKESKIDRKMDDVYLIFGERIKLMRGKHPRKI